MNRRLKAAAAFLAMFAHALGVGAWVPVACEARRQEWLDFHQTVGTKNVEKAWRDYSLAVRSAKPGSPFYAPFPYPKTSEQIVENFKHAYFDRLWGGVPLPARERPVYDGLRAGRVRMEILRIENWEPIRCTTHRPLPYYHLLRLFDRETGREVARSTQFDSGIMALYRHVGKEAEDALPPLTALSALLRSRFAQALAVEQPQYITTSGLLHCRQDVPCIAFRSAGKVYLLDAGEMLYELDATTPRTSVAAHRQQQMRQGLRPLGITESNAPRVSLGFEWATARLVGAAKRR